MTYLDLLTLNGLLRLKALLWIGAAAAFLAASAAKGNWFPWKFDLRCARAPCLREVRVSINLLTFEALSFEAFSKDFPPLFWRYWNHLNKNKNHKKASPKQKSLRIGLTETLWFLGFVTRFLDILMMSSEVKQKKISGNATKKLYPSEYQIIKIHT